MKKIWVTQEALKDWDELYPNRKMDELKTMVSLSAPVTHPLGNRRYNELVFNVRGKEVLGVGLFKYKSNCDICGGRKYTLMHDDFSDESVRVPCHECNV